MIVISYCHDLIASAHAILQGSHPIALEYSGLDPEASWELSILFFASEFKNFKTERNSVTAGWAGLLLPSTYLMLCRRL